MKKFLLAAGAVVLFTAPVQAADLSMKDRSAAPAIGGVSLAGVVVELGIGGGVANAGVTDGTYGTDASFAGFSGDVRVRIERVIAPGWNGSVYGGVSVEDVKGSVNAASLSSVNQAFGYGAGIQLGRTFNGDTSEIYALLGYQARHIGLNSTGFATDLQGIAVGGGIRTALSAHWVAGVEVQDTLYGSYKAGAAKIDETETVATARLGYKF